MQHRIHERALLDALESIPPTKYSNSVWRICRHGRDPIQEWKVVGRWSDGGFPVIYTSIESKTAQAEVHFHYYQKQPIPPSKLNLNLHELNINLVQALKLLDTSRLSSVGVTAEMLYVKSFSKVIQLGYPVMQAVGAAANFLGFDGLIVPSARIKGSNIVLLTDNIAPQSEISVVSTKAIDLKSWLPSLG